MKTLSTIVEATGQVSDVGAKVVGVPVTVATYAGVAIQDYIMYGTAILITVSLVKLAITTVDKGKELFKKFKK